MNKKIRINIVTASGGGSYMVKDYEYRFDGRIVWFETVDGEEVLVSSDHAIITIYNEDAKSDIKQIRKLLE